MISRRLPTCAVLALFAALSAGPSRAVAPPDESRTIGKRVPDVELIDSSGEALRLSDLEGKPLIISPVFTECPHVCGAITESLRDAVLAIEPSGPGGHFEVLTLSFDPDDSLEDLRAYRERHDLPEGWRLAVGETEAVATLLAAIDFQFEPVPGGGFAHPNLIAVLRPDREVSSYVHGMVYQEEDVRKALHAATVSGPRLSDYRGLLIVVAVASALIAVVIILITGVKKPQPA